MKQYQEQALQFECQGEQLVGLLSLPASAGRPPQALADTAILIVVGGPQYRAGSHRQFTLLARALARSGWPVLRFDYRGMGDSTGDALPHFERCHDDIDAAITTTLAQLRDVRRVVLWGLCDGASAALMYVQRSGDPRVQGLCLVNPWARSEVGQARTQVRHYYTRRLADPEFWRKLLRGGIGSGSLRELGSALGKMLRSPGGGAAGAGRAEPDHFLGRMALAAASFDKPVLLALSGNDLTAREFIDEAQRTPQWQRLLGDARCTRIDLPDADHTLSDPAHEAQLHAATLRWLETHCGARSTAGR